MNANGSCHYQNCYCPRFFLTEPTRLAKHTPESFTSYLFHSVFNLHSSQGFSLEQDGSSCRRQVTPITLLSRLAPTERAPTNEC